MLYNALKNGHPTSEAIKAEEQHLPFLNAAMDRHSANQYHEYDMTNKGERLSELHSNKRERREAFEVRDVGILAPSEKAVLVELLSL